MVIHDIEDILQVPHRAALAPTLAVRTLIIKESKEIL